MPNKANSRTIENRKSKFENHFVVTWMLMALCWIAMIIFALHASTHMVGAGDTWVAMACGRHFLNHGVDTNEPFSANSHRVGPSEQDIERWPGPFRAIAKTVGMKTVKYWHPTGWVNQNWLTHVIFYWLTHKSPFADAKTYSYNTLVYWKFVVYILTIICVYYTARLLKVNPALAAAFACFALFTGRSYFDIRPAGFSNLAVAVYILILVLATYRSIIYIWLMVPLVVFWCNLHGGYIYAFIMLVPFVFLHFLVSLSRKRFVSIGLRGVKHTVAAGFAAFAAMMVFNPFHFTNLTHTFEISVSKHAERWRTVREWRPAFEWTNRVGTAFPFLVLLIMCIGLTIFWLFSRFMLGKLLKAPKKELDRQKQRFAKHSKFFAWTAAIFTCWVVFISFSFLDLRAGTFFFAALFALVLLLSICKNVHFIYLQIPIILLAVWACKDKPGQAGTHIYPFILLPCYLIVHTIGSLLSERVQFKPVNIIFVLAAAVVSLLLMVAIFNPFNFDPRLSFDQLLSLKARIWKPRYEGNYPCSYAYLFPVLYVISAVAIIIWPAVPHIKKFVVLPRHANNQGPRHDAYQLPRIDVAFMAVAALTVYMAVRSRRFIPIAAIAACPVLAMFTDQMVRTISAAWNFHRRNHLAIPPMPHALRVFITLVAAAVVIGLGTCWSLKFKYIYLDPWPVDEALSSVFMRMTDSCRKPFWACDFIRLNKLRGKMFNYWTEGGFIAYGQDPCPTTGKTPLQLFMDGRAQAAYMRSAFDLWQNIMSGGEVARRLVYAANVRGRKELNRDEYEQIGQFINRQLRKYDVWVVLMPAAAEWEGYFVRGLEQNENWDLIFYNNKQKMFIHKGHPRAKELRDGVATGKTIFPDEFSRNLMLCHIAYSEERWKQGFDFAVKALRLEPSQAPMQKIVFAVRFPQLRDQVLKTCRDYFDEFMKNGDDYAKQDGYHHRIVAALNAGMLLARVAYRQGDTERFKFYNEAVRDYNEEQKHLVFTKRW